MANTLNLGNGNWAVKKDSLLGYNSENNNYKPLPFDFTRASSATVVNKDGLIETVGSGEPRIDFKDNTKGALLLEPTRSNKVTYSEDFSNAYWTKSGSSVVSGFTSPSGDASAFKLVEDTNNGSHSLQSSFVGAASGADTFSVFAKSGGRFNFSIVEDAYTGINVIVNLQDGTITTTGQQANIISLKNGWYRIDITRADNSNASRWLISLLDSSNNASYQGNGTSGVYIYGAQLEQGSYATSYIPTSGSAVTRVADACSQTPPSGIIGQTEGTLFTEFEFNYSDSNTQVLLKANQSSDANSVGIEILGTTIKGLVNSQSSNIANIQGTIAIGTIKAAIAYKTNDIAFYVNGVQVGVITSGSIAFAGVVDILTIGHFSINGGQYFTASRPFNQAQLYNTRLSNNELQQLTTI